MMKGMKIEHIPKLVQSIFLGSKTIVRNYLLSKNDT